MCHLANVCVNTGRAIILNQYRDQPHKFNTQHKKVNALDDCSSNSDCCSDTENTQIVGSLSALHINKLSDGEFLLDVSVNGQQVQMQYDTAAVQTVINKDIWHKIGFPKLSPMSKLVAYSETPVFILGQVNVEVSLINKTMVLSVAVTKKNFDPLFGVNWMKAFAVCPHEIHTSIPSKMG